MLERSVVINDPDEQICLSILSIVVDKTRLPATSQLGPFSLVKTREMDQAVC